MGSFLLIAANFVSGQKFGSADNLAILLQLRLLILFYGLPVVWASDFNSEAQHLLDLNFCQPVGLLVVLPVGMD